MKVFIFLGPTLSWEDARKELDAIYLPPVAQGDLYRAAKEKPFAIGIIDGYFERLPAVWHKEILWALSQRIHVFGAASMGALRAAELSQFGMQGVGEIYRAFSTEEFEDDDEVAVAHGDASTGFRAVSEAMVNIRATLASAEAEGVLTTEVRRQLEALAKGTFYPERSYPGLLARARQQGLPEPVLETLRAFVSTNRVDQKRWDAHALLRAVRDCCSTGEAPKAPAFTFQRTEAWSQVMDWAQAQPPISMETETVPSDLLAAEVRLMGAAGRGILAAAHARMAAGVLAGHRLVPNVEDRLAKLDRALREQIGAREPDGSPCDDRFAVWLETHGLTEQSYRDFLERQAQFGWLKEWYRTDLDRYLVDELRQTGDYASAARRARDKDHVLAEHGLNTPALRDVELTQSELFAWYFEQRLGRRVPPDMNELLIDSGLGGVAALEREALREFLYRRLVAGTNVEDRDYGNDPGELQRPNASA